MARITELAVNGTRQRIDVEAERSLLSVLRDDLDLTGAKYGCGEGQCGACIVLVSGRPTPACVTPVAEVAREEITTIEGLETDGQLHPLQQAFLEMGALQCGYCIAGMIMSGVALLRDHPDPDEEQIIRAMAVNLCRCGVYPRIVAAVRRAAEMQRAEPNR